MSAEQAARRIWNAARRGDGELILSLPAKLLAGFHGIAPGLTVDMLAWVNREAGGFRPARPAALPGLRLRAADVALVLLAAVPAAALLL